MGLPSSGRLLQTESTSSTPNNRLTIPAGTANPERTASMTPVTFIIIFVTVLLAWIAINTVVLLKKPFDPFPYILLNLILSCIAAIQAPVILMSQNRQEGKDRLKAEHDYRVNLKAEFEIRSLHEKIDHMLVHQWQRLMEIQQVQTDLLSELRSPKSGS
jgi:uncharacterized membrane protein